MFGLSESAVGVKVGGDIVAFLQTGQVFFNPPTARQTQHALAQISRFGLKLDLREAARRYKESRVIERSRYEATVRLLKFFGEQLGTLANQIVLQRQTAEAPQITRARAFIEAQHKTPLSLFTVSRQAGMSTFYFCKMFRKATGLRFTRYVARLRIETAKDLLLNRHYRISEIAFEVGFQSLTHFNRVFREVAGESPTEYRNHLPTIGFKM